MTEFFVGDKVRVTMPHGYSKRGVYGISVLYTTSPEARFESATGRVTQINPVGPYSTAQFLVDFRGFDNGRLGIPWQAQWFREEWLGLVERGSSDKPTAPGPATHTKTAERTNSPASGANELASHQAAPEQQRAPSGSSGSTARAEPPPREAVGSDRVTVAEPPAVASFSFAETITDAALSPSTVISGDSAPPAVVAAIATEELKSDVIPFDVSSDAAPPIDELLESDVTAPVDARPSTIGGDRVGRGAGLLGSLPNELLTELDDAESAPIDEIVSPDNAPGDSGGERQAFLTDPVENSRGAADPETIETAAASPVSELSPEPTASNHVIASGPGWVRVEGDRDCPSGFPIKGNAKSKIFHTPSDNSYQATVPEFCFASNEAALAAGFRPRGGGQTQVGGKKDQRKHRR